MQNRFSLEFPRHIAKVYGGLDVLAFECEEALDAPYRLSIEVTSADSGLDLAGLINQTATFAMSPEKDVFGINALDDTPRVWHGVVREAAKLRSTAQETLYRLTIAPRLAKLADFTTSRLFQNQSVPEIVGALLRKHGFTGADFSFQLTREYQALEYVTQFCESDLGFVQRLLAQVGLFFTFEQGKNTEQLIVADNLEGYSRNALMGVDYRENGGLESSAREAVTQLHISHRTMHQKTLRKNYNYRDSSATLAAEAGFNGQMKAANGVNYAWGDSDFRTQAEGDLVAKLRQERSVAMQCFSIGNSNLTHARPCEVLRLNNFPHAEAPHGWLIIKVGHKASRSSSYVNDFEAIPCDRVWRPEVLPVPKITGTLPAKVSAAAAEESFYATIDEIGRYRVKLPFDLDTWNPGGDSRPVRFAKAYAGSHYGIHFPLHSSVEVALGFTNGDPNRPYIAHVLHDSNHADHVNNQWSTRNVIRTWGKNKLRMEDYKGKEHVKLATEYHKTQLNLGHLVDAKREQRGEGFELRTDGWGVVRGAKGLFLSADSQSGAIGQTRDMAAAKKQLEAANEQTQNLRQAAETAGAELADVQAQIASYKSAIEDLKGAGLLASAPAGMALTTAQTLHLNAGATLAATAGQNITWSAVKNLVAMAGQAIGFFAVKAGIKLIANQGKIQIQAQHSTLELASQLDMSMTSSGGVISLASKNGIVLGCGGGYIKIHPSGEVEIGSTVKLTIKANMDSPGPASLDLPLPAFTEAICKECLAKAQAEGAAIVGGKS